MAEAIRLAHTGGPEVLVLENIEDAAPAAGQAWVEQFAVGVNYLDVMQRNGAAPIPTPNGLGLEAAGVVKAVGPGVTNVAVGDRVGYVLGPLGAYASGRAIAAERLVPLPDAVSFDDAATVLFKGITAHYLLNSTYAVGPGTTILLYGVAGGLGQIMVPWAKDLGAKVIGVVSRQSSVERARASGCDEVLVWGSCDVTAEVARITGGRKADVVYDGVGKVSFEASLNSVRPRGMLVSIGASTGAPAPVEVGTLNAKGSIFLTRPSIVAHATDIAEYQGRAQAVFQALTDRVIPATVWKRYPLAAAAEAHAALESGVSAGTILLTP